MTPGVAAPPSFRGATARRSGLRPDSFPRPAPAGLTSRAQLRSELGTRPGDSQCGTPPCLPGPLPLRLLRLRAPSRCSLRAASSPETAGLTSRTLKASPLPSEFTLPSCLLPAPPLPQPQDTHAPGHAPGPAVPPRLPRPPLGQVWAPVCWRPRLPRGETAGLWLLGTHFLCARVCGRWSPNILEGEVSHLCLVRLKSKRLGAGPPGEKKQLYFLQIRALQSREAWKMEVLVVP